MQEMVSAVLRAVLLRTFVSDDAGVGRSAPLHPPRVTGCERVATLSRSPRAGSAGNWISDDAGNGFGGDDGLRRREGLFG